MASKHEHNAHIYSHEDGKVYLRCTICGQEKDVIELVIEQRHQLDQARALHAEAYELLDALASEAYEDNDEGISVCTFCGMSRHTPEDELAHDAARPDCFVVRAGAFLRAHPTSKAEA